VPQWNQGQTVHPADAHVCFDSWQVAVTGGARWPVKDGVAVDGLDWTDVDELPRVVDVESRCGVRACRPSLRANEPAIQFLLRRAGHGVAGTSQTLADPQEPEESPPEPTSIAAEADNSGAGGARCEPSREGASWPPSEP